MSMTYGSYLCIDELLSLQRPKSDEHDEVLFIIIHQVYELWFRQLLHEFDGLAPALQSNQTPAAQHIFKRVLAILKTMVAQIDVLETMTPLSFNSFRNRLSSASGFQSGQFREFEFCLGRKSAEVVKRFEEDKDAHARLQRRFEEPSLYDCLLRYIAARGFELPADLKDRDVTEPPVANEAMQDVLVDVYKNDEAAREICERFVDLDEGVQEWRYRHVKMVERTIGTKMGTGGSSGAEYLRSTLFAPAFADLWAIRIRF